MKLFIIYIIILILFRIVLMGISKRNYSKIEMLFCCFAYVGLIALAAFRAPSVGTDTLSYISDYKDIYTYTWLDIIERYRGYELFYFICKLFSLLGLPIFMWFAFIEIIYVSAIARLIHKDSTDKIYSIILFITIGLYMFSLAGLKQTMAMGLVLHAFMEMRSKRYVTTVLLFILAFFAHPTAIIFLPAFLLYHGRNIRNYNVVVICLILLLVFGSKYMLVSFSNMIRLEHFERYLSVEKTYSIWTLLFYILMIIASLPFINNYSKNALYQNEHKFEFSCLIIACSLQYLASLSPSLFRLALYYTPFFLVYMPNVFNTHSDVTRKVVKLVLILAVILFFAYTNRNFVYSLA